MTASASFSRRAAEGAAFVGFWMMLGASLRLDANQYLLIGVPLTALFQLFVRRRPLRALWVRDAPSFALDRSTWRWIIFLAIVPARLAAGAFIAGNHAVALWGACALCGAAAAAYAIREFHRETVRALLLCAAIAGTIGIAIMAGASFLRPSGMPTPLMNRLQIFITSLLEYFPGLFLLEEVAFRGALDAHLHHTGESRPWASAFLASALWGLWHLPIVPGGHLAFTLVSLVAVHCAIGVPLSFFWRRSGNLAVPAFSHALIDAVRNALAS